MASLVSALIAATCWEPILKNKKLCFVSLTILLATFGQGKMGARHRDAYLFS